LAQKATRIFLSPKSNITTAQVSEGFAKACPNIVVTQNEEKADYILEAAETASANEGTTYHQWHFTLMNRDGDVLLKYDDLDVTQWRSNPTVVPNFHYSAGTGKIRLTLKRSKETFVVNVSLKPFLSSESATRRTSE